MIESLSKLNPTPCKLKVRSTVSGIHLFDRTTGTNVLFDEIRLSSTKFSQSPRQVSIALTNACDLTCSYCYAPKTPAKLPIENLKKWVRELDENGTIGVGFGGGEPTLYPGLAEICKYTTNETSLAVTLTTHAHRLTPKLLASLEGNIHFVRVSMDGVGTTYEANRGRKFDNLLVRMNELQSIVPFGINYVINSQTIADLDHAIEIATTMKAREFLLLPEQPTPSRVGMDDITKKEMIAWVQNYRGSIPLTINEHNADGLPTINPLLLETGLAAYAHIDAKGILKSSSYSSFGIRIDDSGIIATMQFLKTNLISTL